MATVQAGNVRLHYQLDGHIHGPVLVLSNSLGTDLSMWDGQIEMLSEHFRVLRYDSRGHGLSEAPPAPYRIEDLARDAIALLDALSIERVHFCGLSIGGMVGQWLGVHAAQRLHSLTLCNTSPQIGTFETWNARIDLVRREGVAAVADAVIGRWFTEAFRGAHADAVRRIRESLVRTPVEGYLGGCTAVRDADLREAVASIGVPTLVITGTHDPSTPAADGRKLADAVNGARYVELDSAHLSNIEARLRFNTELLDFLTHLDRPAALHGPADERERFKAGLKARRAVLGDAYVDRSLARRNPFNQDFQDLITRYAWGEIWTRPGLPRHTRSLLTLAMMVALNRADEFKLHVRAAFHNGVTRDEIAETLLQCAIYCGVPAANSAFHWAQEVFEQMDAAR
ncbi:MAG TPA: 3-oxoadipate enol-lactonase [Burkholderiaceae bacterium]